MNQPIDIPEPLSISITVEDIKNQIAHRTCNTFDNLQIEEIFDEVSARFDEEAVEWKLEFLQSVLEDFFANESSLSGNLAKFQF